MEQPGNNISIGGGASLARSFMELDLIDEYFLTVFPVLLGKGNRLLGDLSSNSSINLKLLNSKIYDSGTAFYHFKSLH